MIIDIKRIFILFILFFFQIFFCTSIYATYTLPYPSTMPGNKLYKITRLVDELKKYWFFGSIAQIKYHIALSDKYFVEAKTLFDYNQYLLAADALKRSDYQYQFISKYIAQGEKEGKDMSNFKKIHKEQSAQHVVILLETQNKVPNTFTWTPEKEKPTELPLNLLLQTSIDIRKNDL
jgi:hypothetical protein